MKSSRRLTHGYSQSGPYPAYGDQQTEDDMPVHLETTTEGFCR